MKKLLGIIGVVALLVLPAAAQQANPYSYSFLNASAVLVSNVVHGVTNLAAVNAPRTTNAPSTIFTNFSGTRIITASNFNSGVNLFKTVPIHQPGYGLVTPIYTNTAPAVATLGPWYANVTVRGVGGSGANSAVTLVFSPIFSASGVESTNAADLITVAITPNVANPVILSTKLEATKLVGARGLILVSASNADTDAASDFWLTEVSLNGFRQ